MTSASECATATMARLWPSRGLSRSYCRWNSEPFFLEADHAHSTNVDRTQGLPRSAGARFFRPALSLLPGATPAQALHLAPLPRLSHHKSNRLSWLEGSLKDACPSALEITCKM